MKGLDSAARFSAAAAKAAGYDVGARYINQNFTGIELADYNAHGLTLLPIYEESGKPGSFADGQRQGRNALNLLTRLGLADYGCAFTDDVSGYPYAQVKPWVQGIRSVFPNHLVYYGPAHIGDQLCDEGIADSVWIEGAFSYSRPYIPGKTPTARHACGVQFPPPYVTIGGVTCDRNDFYSTPWLPGHSTSTPTTESDWFDMATQADLKAVLMDDEVLSAIALKVLYWLGNPEAEAQPKLDKNTVTLRTLAAQIIEPNHGAGPAEEGTLRRAVDDIYTKVGAGS